MMDGIVAIFRRAAPLLFWVVAGCSSASSEDAALGNAGGSGGETNSPVGAADPSGALAFLESDLLLVPGQTKEIGVQVSGARDAVVRFALVGDSRDAFLDDDEVRTADGIARVELTAPSEPAAFVVRASLEDGAQAELRVSTGEGFASLVVVPRYEAEAMGRPGRAVDEWVATVRTGQACETYSDIPPPDGPLVGTAPGEESPTVERVPAGAPLTVTLRAGHYIGGCANVSGLVADETNTVQVTVVDRPLQMAGAAFTLQLGVRDSLEWRLGLGGVAEAMLAALAGDSTSDVSLVLDWMARSTEQTNPDLHAAITTERASSDWDAIAAEALGPGAESRLHDEFEAALLGGLDRLARDASITGELEASSDPTLDTATVHLRSVGGATASASGFPASVSVSWLDGANDMVQIGGAFDWVPERLLVSLAEAKAGGMVGVTEGVAARFGCDALATALADGGADGFAYATCDAPCVAAACESAVQQLWEALGEVSVGPSKLVVSANGTARIDDEALPIGFDGEWVATSTAGQQYPIKFGGPATGVEVFEPIPK